MNLNEKLKNYLTHEENDFLKVENSYNKKLVTWLDLNLQVALLTVLKLKLLLYLIF